MAHRVCPWWLGYLLASPLRRLIQDPRAILAPFLRPGMTALDVGPGMGFFTLPMAEMVGAAGRVVAVDLQERMLTGLRRRATKAGLAERIELRRADPDDLHVGDLGGKADFVLAFAMVHEVPDATHLMRQLRAVLAPGGKLLVAEPRGHVSDNRFASSLAAAEQEGLAVVERPAIPRSRAAVLCPR